MNKIKNFDFIKKNTFYFFYKTLNSSIFQKINKEK